jgi:2'-5' RNA ligase
MRLFIAIDLPEHDVIRAAQEQLGSVAGVRIVKPEHAHLTLKFLGHVPQELLDDFVERIERIRCPPFEITLDGIGGFPDMRWPRVVFIAGSEPAELASLARAVDDATREVKPDNPFHAHVTIARTDGKTKLPVIAVRSCTFTVREIVLYDSDLSSEGPAYTAVRKFALRN